MGIVVDSNEYQRPLPAHEASAEKHEQMRGSSGVRMEPKEAAMVSEVDGAGSGSEGRRGLEGV
jgi:hypothetical protein